MKFAILCVSLTKITNLYDVGIVTFKRLYRKKSITIGTY